ncbi:MAG TPA: DUF3810 domain-containing protein [Flavobacterium sp.]|jgi:hypothetical protein
MKKKYILPLLLPIQIVLLQILSFFPDVVEQIYSNGLYVGISTLSRTIFGWIPFSIGDIIYFIVIFLLLRWLWNRRKTFLKSWKDNLLGLLSFISVFYFLFNFLWGINYHRVGLPEKLKIGTEYSDADLMAFTERIIKKTNEIHLQITGDDNAKVVVPYTHEQVFEKNVLGYAELARQYPYFAYEHSSAKKSIISVPLTYMGFAGYLNPFTNEAQVNYLLPMYTFPTVASHEMAHQIGYASESEANFVGYLASVKNQDLYFKYSGYVTALRYCLGNWEARDERIFENLLKKVNPGIVKNFEETQNFWDSYESFIETGFHIFYDNFLKLNQQDEGLDSYSRFVDLLVNYYRTREL